MNYLELIKKNLALSVFSIFFIIVFFSLGVWQVYKGNLKAQEEKEYYAINRAPHTLNHFRRGPMFLLREGLIPQDKYFLTISFWMVNQDIKFIRHLFFRMID